MLNEWLGKAKQPLLKMDGLVGPKTIGAITAFQRSHGITADGRADASGRTINALFQEHLVGLQGMLDLSRVSSEVNESAAKKTALSDPELVPVIEHYVKTLRKES
jgi:peptidoglycan hydrolase-like protein with peptidoglycan-binding domain